MKAYVSWEKAAKLKLYRLEHVFGGTYKSVKMEAGVNFFILMLEQLGMKTLWSCEGHPSGFYIVFTGPYYKALRVRRVGYFSVELEHNQNEWSLRLERRDKTKREKNRILWYTARSWEEKFGKLDFESIKLREELCAPQPIRSCSRSMKTCGSELLIRKAVKSPPASTTMTHRPTGKPQPSVKCQDCSRSRQSGRPGRKRTSSGMRSSGRATTTSLRTTTSTA